MADNQITPMVVYPTLGSLQEVVDLANSKVPVSSKNEMYAMLMIYHNTLLKETHGQVRPPSPPSLNT